MWSFVVRMEALPKSSYVVPSGVCSFFCFLGVVLVLSYTSTTSEVLGRAQPKILNPNILNKALKP